MTRLFAVLALVKKNASSDNSAPQDRGADRRGSQPPPDNRRAAGDAPARKP
jgi:hypothetical protein